MLQDISIEEFIKELASEKPTPGGGGAAALSAALSAALNCMVFNFTVGKKVYENYDKETKKLINSSLEKSDKLKDYFLCGIDKDAEAFSKIINSYKLPQSTEEEKAYRHKCIQEASKFAAKVPEDVANNARELFELIWISAKLGNKNLITDAGAAAIMAEAAIETSILNIKINIGSIEDKELKARLEKTCRDLLLDSKEWKDKILSEVYSNI
ncbi:formiminotetrahydrofolate cyclodeaminase [Clostridium acetobutylicum]|uniref:Methenyl tetrahydrofolate cyclohydrolase (Serine cycle enzyme) n=1 Tax=Clostridium acetobutylicum (strain ATCC 824 / DSM 792 / JCM 1419 / IAM 19013 / LMG 5710 / NBRC 13948 / NRRL B-527 / VKM B-1787 / 2291 / W) TaxID=272562 RepID=Q97GQ6_CLOAB|nr:MULTISPECIES: cyclodeaminase/cyclohydrolase family protein [Clostridium]AAK80266.1 Methenyl tetrahydrofolate cyclohydrolase (serine cycle enzyme) [Clostridium acetobutylicum ATCC 824]ADZ21362.1 Methenyl tetrahydrofolate cyclohydrolase (serine cycle enzyme) [Clostridium acetobutylicum EA 2018]AEI33752.1 Methenyl tetrahydrofolate cyclohydrolase (serine cycle enzyme) [Clostridium acetobutylicum DSM 1731]AWV79311.1 methenyltetrahydrofolate cyclohydrolase [Clostridium acetobutylicum]MBC2394719.1